MNAIITIKYRCPNICEESDLGDNGMTFEELIRSLVHTEGIWDISEDDEIIKIETYN